MAKAAGGSRLRGRPFRSLRGRGEFQRIRREGSRRHCEGITVVVAIGRSGPPRVGVVAGRGTGGAVARNRAKRRLREAVARAPLRPDCDYVVTGGRGALEAAFADLVARVGRAVREVNEQWSK